MTLLDNGPDTLTVQPEVVVIDDRRNPQAVPGPKTFTVAGRLQPLNSNETAADGEQVATQYRFLCRDFPAGPWSAVTDSDGAPYDVVGEPARYNGSDRTRHVTVTLQARTPKAV